MRELPAHENQDVLRKVRPVQVDPSEDLDDQFAIPSGGFDFVLVDGDHRYGGVRRDSDFALRQRSPRGIVLWHDCYCFPGYVADAPKRGIYPVLHELQDANPGMRLRHIKRHLSRDRVGGRYGQHCRRAGRRLLPVQAAHRPFEGLRRLKAPPINGK